MEMLSGTLRERLIKEAARRKLRVNTPVDMRRELALANSKRVTLSDLKIRTKDKRLVKFQPNPVQMLYMDMLHEAHPSFDWRNGHYSLRGCREDILKARQFGFSTLWLALFFLDTINTPLTQTIIIAHEGAATEKLFRIIHRFYANLPEHKKRPTRYSSKTEIEFADNDSMISVGTAGGQGVGRGGTINNVHLSEKAFWPAGNDIETGLLESVPFDGNVIRETTANGLNEYFEERQAEKRGDSNFVPRFFGWYLHPDYQIAVPPDFQRTQDEAKLAEAYSLSDNQLSWRRQKVRDLKAKFAQEYPSNEDEAFLTSGNPYFDVSFIKALNDRLQDKSFDPLSNVDIPERFKLLRAAYRDGQLLLWKLPEEGKSYAIGADTAEGLNDVGDADYDVADVLDKETWEQVAHVSGRWDTHHYGLLLAELGRWYNTALLGIERNNHGHAVINAALLTARYPEAKGNESGLYFHEGFDEMKTKKAMRPGWPTTAKTKYFALDELATALEENDLQLNARETVGQLMRFVHLPGGKAGGDGKSHDDCVIALSIAVVMAKLKTKRWHQDKAALGRLKSSLTPKTEPEPEIKVVEAQAPSRRRISGY